MKTRARNLLILGAVLLAFAPAGAAPDPFDPTGRWTIVGNGGGTLELSGAPGSLVAHRIDGSGSERGRATFVGNRLRVQFASSGGFVNNLLGASGPAGPREASYDLDPVEGAFRGQHLGSQESLRRSIGGNAIDLLVDGKEMLPLYLHAIRTARHHVHIECYLWQDDSAANEIGDALIERARSGVRVRAIFDGQGSSKTDKLRARLTKGGVSVLYFNPRSWRSLGQSLLEVWDILRGRTTLRDTNRDKVGMALDNRDHRKVLVVDGRVAFVGGICLTKESLHEWHDVHSRLRGPAVALVQKHFLDLWKTGGGPKITDDDAALFPALRKFGDYAVDVVTTVPGTKDEVRRLYYDRIRGARREIFLENPYFADEVIVDEMVAAARRGVKVTLILPADEVNDVSIMGAYHSTVRGKLFVAGVDVRSYPRMSHGKIAMIDGRWATVGSTNLDNRSFARDFEENLSVDDPRFASVMKKRVFDPDVQASKKWTYADRPQSVLKKVYGFFSTLIRDWL